MKFEDAVIGKKYPSNANPLVSGDAYEIIKKFLTVCWVQLYENGVPSIIYKGIPYKVLGPKT